MPQSHPNYLFKNKEGNCDAYATFSEYALNKAGFGAWIELVNTAGGLHFTTFFKKDDGYYVFDNALRKIRGFRGPFESVNSIKQIYDF
jgi:hypothetical protein